MQINLLKNTFLTGIILSISLSLLVTDVDAVAPISVDDFSTAQGIITDSSADGNPVSDFINGTMLGAERDVSVNTTSGAFSATTMTTGGVLYFTIGTGVVASTTITWDGNDDDATSLDATGLGGIDLSQGATLDAFDLGISNSDRASNMTITVYTDAANFSQITLAVPITPSADNHTIPFADFGIGGGTGADFSNVGAITLSIDGDDGLDIELDHFEAVSSLVVTKTDTLQVDGLVVDGLAGAGDTLRYTIIISNPDDAYDATVSNISFSDTPDANTTLVVGSVTSSAGTVTTGNTAGHTSVGVNVGNLADNSSVTITFDVTINNPVPAAVSQVINQGIVSTNTLSIPSDDPDDATSTIDPTITAIVRPNLILNQSDSPDPVIPGQTITYTITLENTGTEAAVALTLYDTYVDATIGLVSDTISSGSCLNSGASPLTCNVLSLPVGNTVTLTLDLVVEDPVPAGATQHTNSISVRHLFGASNSNFAVISPIDESTTITASPNVTATKTAIISTDNDTDGFADVGDIISYTLTISNAGNKGESGINFASTIDSNTSLNNDVAGTCLGTVNSGNTIGDVSVNVDTIDVNGAGDSCTITYSVTVVQLFANTTNISSQGTITGDNTAPTLSDDPNDITSNTDPTLIPADPSSVPVINNSAQTQSDSPNLDVFDPAISKIGFLLPSQVGVQGEELEWIVTVSNTGNVVGTNVTVTDTLINALQVDSVDAPSANVTINGQTVTVVYPILNIGETVLFSIFTTVLDGVTVENTACVNADNQGSEECATSSSVSQLPNTGETPFWWMPLLGFMILSIFAGFFGYRLHFKR